ncbi:gliding motility-associated C-terminal domain-containing protein [uncultured Flavobacterium sp.]|uniref:Ig-like domain-containing protein n=2 Tax=uncultured Flavobacterium sp. TaxID=165435 RepID=UPI0025F6CF26|nr:gliding motility-associated C-terminal domain-containing protein [uncultured Flavobacterium sp.]
MRNSTFCKSRFSRLILFILFATLPIASIAQVCGTPGVDGPVAVSSSVNTYFPISGNITLNAGAQSILLAGVPATDQYSNNFGTTPISAGDLILIIQMQDATINYTNTTSYGSGTSNSGPDNLGGTGFTSLGNSGIFEYVIATNSVPLTGGNLTFKGTGTNGGVLNSFYNADPTASRGKRTFQVVRVPQYSNLTLTANITTPPFNGVAGGIIAFNVSGTFNFNGFSIDGSARGFRGGYSPKANSGVNDSKTYVDDSSKSTISGKGEGIAGTPKYMWDGFNQVANTVEGMPGGSSGRGAPANAGGGGNDHNTGGGGGGNGGFGGLGGAGWQGGGGDLFSNNLTGAGRPGSKSFVTTTTFPRLIMGGGGGAGDANDASTGVKGGVGGAIILINAGNVLGSGTIYANGGKGAPGTYANSPDGAGGGGAGGTVLLNVSNNSTANIQIQANGGAGGNTENDNNNEHGPGGGGGGGIICHNVSSTVTITTSVLGGAAGKSNAGNGITHGAIAGTAGYVSTFTVADVPPNLQVNANCFPVLETKVKTLSTTAVCNSIDEKVSYEIEIKNTGAGNAAGVMLDFSFPTGIEFDSATAAYSTGASGSAGTLANSATATANNPVFGGFNIAQNGVVTITLVGKVAASMAAGTYSSNAQALYLDPTRTTANSTRRITAFTNAYGTANKTYEGTGQANVPGVNFNGTSTAVDDISILALPAAPTVTVTQTTCASPTGTITVNTPANGSGISYTLTGTNPVSAPITNTNGTFSGLVPGTYSVTTTNAQGCTSAPNAGIVVNSVAGAPTATGVAICQDGTGSLTASSPCAVSSTVGPLFGTASNVSGTGSGTFDWTNPAGANSNGSGVASASSSSNTTTKYLMATDFKFSIPTNAKIKGIEVVIGRYANRNTSSNNVTDNVVRLIKTTGIVGENKKSTDIWSNSSTAVVTYGGGTDLWTTAWTPDDINNSGFGIALSASISKSGSNTVTASVDYMQITVSYTIGEIEWYTTSTGSSPIYTGTSFNPVGVAGSGLTNTATAGTKTYYAACSGNSNCRAAVNFVINAKPTITGSSPASRCGTGEVTLGAEASAGTINWFAAPTGGLSLGTGESFTTPSLSTTTSYYVEATDNSCTTPTRTEVKATINTIPTINSTTEASNCGAGSLQLKATASTGATINWYADPTTSTVLGTGATFNTPTLSATTTYYVGAVTAAGCTSTSRIAVAAVINTPSSIVFTSGTRNPTVCSGAPVPSAVYTFGGSATNATVSNLPAGLSAAVDTNAKTVTISGNPTAAGTYTITTVGHTAPCTEATIQGTVTLTPNVTISPFSPATSSRCQGAGTDTRTTTASNSTSISYSLDAASIAGGNTINATTGVVTYAAGWSGTTTITASAAGCNGPATTTHTVTVNALPTATITGNLTACLTTTLTAVSNASSPTYVWYKNNVVISGQTSSSLVVNSDGDYKVKVRNTVTSCEQTSVVSTVKVNDTEKPVKPTLTDITAECSATVTRPTTTDNCAGTVTGTTADPLTYSAQGTYTINWTFNDGNGNTETATQKVIIKDTQKPAKPVLADVTGECSATVTAPTTTDNCAGTVTGTTADPLTYNAQGTYNINWTFNDGNGNTETATQKVIIKDTQKPAKPVLADVTGECSATVTAPTTTDNCAGTVTGTTTDPLAYNAQGTYTINWTFNDGNGNTETATQKVIIKDTQKPAKPVLVDVTGECSATVTAPTTTDNCAGTVTGTTADPLTYNAQGAYTINWTFNDGNGNTETATQKVIIKDTQKPAKPVLADVTGECSATVTAPTTTDNCAGTVTGTTADPLTYSAQGTYTINWTFNDGNGNTETATQKVIIKDTQKPAKPVLADVTGECSATVTAPTTTDSCAGIVTGTTADPLTYNAQGTYTINWTFNDGNGNTETATQKVIIKDTQKPAKPVLADVTGECSATVTAPTTTDNCAGTVTGTTADPLTYNTQGTYTINWTFNDGNGNTETATQKVIIKDTQKPAKPVLADVTGECSATVTAPTTTDNCAGTVTGTTTDPLTYNAQGTYTINWTFNDGNGNTETATQKVIVKDTQKPSINCPSLVVVSADANSCSATGVTLGAPTVSDNCTGTVTVTNDAPSSFPIGNTTVTWTATDAGGNTETCTQTVKVIGSIEANDDTISSSNGALGGTVIANIFDNDILNCNKVNISDIDVALTGSLPSVLNFNNADGAVSVKPNTPTGTYTFDYSICEIANSGNCNSATVTIKIVNDLIAVNDNFGTKSSGTSAAIIGNVKSNDTLDGAFVTSGNTVVTANSSGPLSVDANGDVTLAANTPSGTYSIAYVICEKNANPANCKTATAEVKVVNAIEAVEDIITPVNGNIGGTTISLATNDKLNGSPITVGTAAGEVKFEIIGTLPSGLTLNADHTITVAPNTPKGNYNVEYKICENTNPSNCDSVIVTVPVTAGNLVANEDVIPSVLGSNVPQTLGKNVFDNDTKNSQPLNSSDVTLKTTAADPKGYLTLDANGNIVLGANPPAGDYELTYEICEKLNPDNCSSNKVKVTVGTPIIDAVEDVIASINGNIGGTTISLAANDKLNGSPITVGTAAGEVKFEIIGTLPSGLTLNADHTITVAPNTPKGNYNVEYKICENTNPTNCDSVIVTVPVTGGNLVANEDLVPSAVGVNIPQKVINVFENDTKNGNKLVPSDVDLKVTQADPKGYLTVDVDGNVVLAPNAPAGDYELTYTICEKLNPDNCSSNAVKVAVTEPKMTVIANSYCSNNVPYVNYTVTPDNFTTNNLLTVKWIDSNNNVVATQVNLPLSGNILWPGAEIDTKQNGTDWPGWILNNGIWSEGADGFEATRNGVKMEFSLNPTVTVAVAYPPATPDCNARPTFSIKANNDEAGPINVKKGANAAINIFENDLLNGAKLKASDVILSVPVVHPNITLNADGSINIAANTADGVYELTYQICEAANTSNCSQAVIKITVNNVVDPIVPTENKITLNNDNDVSADGINGSLEFVNVLDNDLINGQPINPADVVVRPLTESPYFEWNADGTVSVKPNTPGGNYPLTYQVCEKANGTNCSTAVLNVFVEVPAISVIKTAVFNDENKSGFANAGETITYKFTVTNTGNVPLAGITINDPLPGVVVSGQAINLGVNESNETNFTAVYKITQEDINRGSVSNQATVKGSSARGVVVEDQSDDASNSGDNPTVLDLNGCSIKVMNAFSPNGDNKNARFYIRGIECYPDNTVEIYNRWGVLVFNIDQYNNNDRVFVGYSNGRSTIKQADGLPVGTYYYILKYKDNAQQSHQESGYLYLNK